MHLREKPRAGHCWLATPVLESSSRIESVFPEINPVAVDYPFLPVNRFFRTTLIIGLILLFLLSKGTAKFFTDFWWYQEIGNTGFFLKSIGLKAILFSGSFF